MNLSAVDISKCMEFIKKALSDVSDGVMKRLDATYDNFSVKVYAVGNNIRIDIIPNQKD